VTGPKSSRNELRPLFFPTVLTTKCVPGVHRVYNMTVEAEHVYHVSTLGVLAHNQDCTRLRNPKNGRFVTDPANPPSRNKFTDAQRRAAWKRLAEDPNSGLTKAQRAEIKARGWRGPQRVNKFGEVETMELSHEPIPLRDAGTKVVPRWPDDHAAKDPHRKLKKR
jgi:hypothetical protein